MAVAPRLHLSPDEFLDWELRQDEKHEYHRGEVFLLNRGPDGMAGGTETHARIIGNLYLALRLALRDRGCTVYTDALGVRVEAEDLFTYPDLSVVCGEATFYDDRRTRLLNPTALVEVLSPSTEGYDRTTKSRFYRQIPSLEAYVVVSQDGPAVDVLVRDGDGWRLHSEDAEGRVAVSPLDVALDLAEVYEGVTFPDPAALDRPAPRA